MKRARLLCLLILTLFSPAVFAEDERQITVPDLSVHVEDFKPNHVFVQPKELPDQPCDDAKWTNLEKWMGVATTALIIVDMSQTFSLTARGVGENNPLLPRHPNKWALRGALVGSIALYWGGSVYLDRPYRTMWQTGYLSLEAYAVFSNQFRMHPSSGYAFPW